MNRYEKWSKEWQDKINNFPMFFAFSEKQFEEGLAKLGVSPTAEKAIVSIGAGGYIRKEDVDEFKNLFSNRKSALRKEMEDDKFLYDAFLYELYNHEYGYTGDDTDAIEALGLDAESVYADERMLRILKKACAVAWDID